MQHPLLVKTVRTSALVGLIAGIIWHVLPHVVWARQIEPELLRHPQAWRLHVPVQREFTDSPDDWQTIAFDGVVLRVPLADSEDRSCGDLPGYCHRTLRVGHLSVHASALTESYTEMLDTRAPDSDDISLLRSASANWKTILALRERVNRPWPPIVSWRFESKTSRGVVTLVRHNNRHSHVVVVFPLDGGGGRTIVITRQSDRGAGQIIGTIAFSG